MHVRQTAIPDVVILEPKVIGDARGFFFESYQQQNFDRLIGSSTPFVQDNHSGSAENVLRGLHFQTEQSQGKLVRVVSGAIYDVAVDIRKGSDTFGRHVGVELSAENRKMLWIPKGFAHGFLTLADWNEVLYKATDFYSPQFERTLRWDDPSLAIDWPLKSSRTPSLSEKDSAGLFLADLTVSV